MLALFRASNDHHKESTNIKMCNVSILTGLRLMNVGYSSSEQADISPEQARAIAVNGG
jgi:hypothetical protein